MFTRSAVHAQTLIGYHTTLSELYTWYGEKITTRPSILPPNKESSKKLQQNIVRMKGVGIESQKANKQGWHSPCNTAGVFMCIEHQYTNNQSIVTVSMIDKQACGCSEELPQVWIINTLE